MKLICALIAIIGGIWFYKAVGWWAFLWSSLAAIGLYSAYDDRKTKREAAEKAARDAAAREQWLRNTQSQLERDQLSLRNSVNELAAIAAEAAAQLRHAESEFEDHAYAPFWDAIESTVSILGKYDSALASVRGAAERLDSTARQLGSPVSSKALVTTLPDVVQPAHDLRTLVRRAQRDFQFAQIFEVRRTNAILVAGFQTLTTAIDGLGSRLESAIREIKTATHARR